ncbi:MAG TPA: penicillin-binding transpeptidase domain-containing protein [Clostridia bacterium]|nr:penicillin-binding transpeptidase domain-containing protein [Clostridia bacterium]
MEAVAQAFCAAAVESILGSPFFEREIAMAAKTARQDLAQRLIVVLAILIFLGFGAGIIGVAMVQIVNGEEYRSIAEGNQLRDTVVAAQRGVIYDRNMKVLAKSASAYRVFCKPNLIGENEELRDLIVKRLSEILDMTDEKVRYKTLYTKNNYIVIKSKVETEQMEAVGEFMREKVKAISAETGKLADTAIGRFIGIDPDVKRYYPYSNFASTVIGFTGTDDVGLAGLELKYNSVLTGTPGRIITAQNGGLNSNSMPIEYESIYDAKQGTSLVLTIDEVIQRYLEKSLEQAYIDAKAQAAYGIVMDVKTGAILAMANKGDYDLNNPFSIENENVKAQINEITDKEMRSEGIQKAQYSQWRNRAISDSYEPGSVFKIFTLSAALEEKVVSLDTTYSCSGAIQIANRRISCWRRAGHGTQNLTKGLVNSCNPFFITIGQRLGQERFFKYFEAFGFTETTGIDLPAEAKPVANVTYHPLKTMSIVNLASSSFGQTFQITPIQMINAIAAIANGGKLMTPYVVMKTLDENGNVVSQTKPQVRRQVISESTAQTVSEMMERVVIEGTGKNGYVAGYRVAGKTGTSEKISLRDEYGKKYVASFGCFAPTNDPEIVILIAIDDPKGQINGGQIAAPVAAEIIQNTMIYLNIEPQYTEAELAKLDTQAPNLVGLSISAAQEQLKGGGYSVRVIGGGKSVVAQIPACKQNLPQNGVVILYTQDEVVSQKAVVPDLSGLTITQANKKAVDSGFNIKITGNTLNSSELVSYKQSEKVGSKLEYGATITVHFKSNSGVSEVTE